MEKELTIDQVNGTGLCVQCFSFRQDESLPRNGHCFSTTEKSQRQICSSKYISGLARTILEGPNCKRKGVR